MLRRSYSLTALLAALATLITVLAQGQPRPALTNPATPKSFSERLSDSTVPICYIQLENGQLRDLRGLCGKRLNSPVRPGSLQRPNIQSDVDAEVDESAPRATPKPQPASSQTNPTSPSPQPTASPSPQPTASPGNVQRLPANPSTIAPSTPHPLEIREDRD
ncbi:hypothetical protein [Stenomitos frigidus]|uniref:hypothetical protein n=1 Tax=Stenomitos frigidus TaxID=1886765 RepID=UPI0011B292A8|nr:hypothetical protein [Stenomitos frigidus]